MIGCRFTSRPDPRSTYMPFFPSSPFLSSFRKTDGAFDDLPSVNCPFASKPDESLSSLSLPFPSSFLFRPGIVPGEVDRSKPGPSGVFPPSSFPPPSFFPRDRPALRRATETFDPTPLGFLSFSSSFSFFSFLIKDILHPCALSGPLLVFFFSLFFFLSPSP